MSEKINLKELERKAWTSYFEDGLWDIFMGLLMLTGGIRALTDNVLFTLGFVPAVLVVVVGKRFITTPRIGHVKFGRSRKVKQRRLIAIISISVIATFVLLLLPLSGLALPKISISPIIAVWIAVIFGLLAYYMDFRRLYLYGLLFAMSEVLWGQFDKPVGSITQTISGIAILLIGLFVLVRFLRKYPLPAEMRSYGGD